MNDNLPMLRDIHIPDSVSIFPLAPGWYIIFFMAIIVLGGIVFLYHYKKRQKIRHVSAALSELVKIREEITILSKTEILIQLSALLRRTALAKYPRRDIAGLQGEAWLQFLDHTSNTTAFTEGPGHVLITGPYQRQATVKIEVVLELAEFWIKKVLSGMTKVNDYV